MQVACKTRENNYNTVLLIATYTVLIQFSSIHYHDVEIIELIVVCFLFLDLSHFHVFVVSTEEYV